MSSSEPGEPGEPSKPSEPAANRVSSYILFSAIAGAPLPFGSRDATTVALWCLVLGVGLVFASPRYLRTGHKVLLIGIGLLVACYAFVLHEQLSSHPWLAQPNPIWAKASELLGRPIPLSVSIVRGEPFYALGPPLAAVLALTLGLVVGADPYRANQALLIMAWSGIAYAAYGIVSLLLGPFHFWGREQAGDVRALTATFVNRNTAAAFFGSCAVTWLVLLMSKIRGRLPPGPIRWADVPKHVLAESSHERALVVGFCMYFVCLTAMFMTGSRGGVIISLFVMVVAFVGFFRRDLPRGKSLVVAALAAGACGLILMQLLAGNVEARIDAGGLSDQGRLAAYQSTLRIIADNPWFGTGLGTFAWAFPVYRSGDISIVGIWDIAHSTPLELAAELGIPLAAVIALAWIVAFFVLIRGSRRSRRETIVPLAALAGSLIAILHSSIDFSLQVPGYTIVVFALVGIGLAESFNVAKSHRHRGRRHKSTIAEDTHQNGKGDAV